MVDRHVVRLIYSNDSSFSSITDVYGEVAYTEYESSTDVKNSYTQTRSTGFLPSVTFTGTTYIKVQHYSDKGNTDSGDAMGVSSPWSSAVANASSPPIWTTIEIEDLATAVKEPTISNNVWNVVKTDTQTITGTSWTEVSTLTQTVTSTSASTKFLITVVCNASTDNNEAVYEFDSLARLVRTTSSVDTVIGSGSGDTDGFGQSGGQIGYYEIQSMNLTYLDTPGVGTHTYHVMGRATNTDHNMLINTRGAGTFKTYSQMTIQQFS